MLKVRGGVIESWDRFDPFHIYGVKPPGAANGAPVEPMATLGQSAGPALLERDERRPWHPDSPLFWFGVLAATTLGLIGASTSVRVGPFKAAVAAGES